MHKHIWLYLVIGISILVIPTVVYLIWLIPQLSEYYNTLLASGGIISCAGYIGTIKIPDSFNNSKLLKLASGSFTILATITVVQEFIGELIFLAVIAIISFIIFKIFLGVYKNAKRKRENTELAEEISRNIIKNSK